jgi:flagellar hook-length control protein FliK
MNIESASLSSLPPSGGAVVSTSQPLADASVISKDFSGALVAQVELLTNIQAGDVLPLHVADLAGLQGVNGSSGVAGTVSTQDFAALLGNDLPPSYKINGDDDHAATLAAVTDTLKYMALGAADGEKAAQAVQNIKDVIAMETPVPVDPNVKNVVAGAVQAEQITAGVVEQGIKDAVVAAVPVQMDLKQANDKPGKKPVEGDTQITGGGADDTLAVIILPVAMPVEQGAPANNLVPAGVSKEEALLPFIKPSTGDVKPNQSAKAPDDVLPGVAVVGQSVQGKQDINLKYFDTARQAEKTGPVERQALSIAEGKIFPKVDAEISQLNRPVDNKTEIPAMTKPLAHPEWNKDLGERIVWMSSKAIPSAEIRLNPPHLGPISVRVDVADDRATVVFTAQHAATREAIEASIPKLREMMSAQQLNLVDVNVSQGSASDQGRSQAQNFAQTAEGRDPGAAVDGNDDVEQEIESGRAVVSKGLLSIYA